MNRNPWEIAIEFGLPGKNSPTGCWPFAQALYNELVSNGTPCAVVRFDWVGTADYNRGIADRHNIVVYKDDQGRLWSTDATARAVTWLPEGINLLDVPSWLNKDKSITYSVVVLSSNLGLAEGSVFPTDVPSVNTTETLP